MTLDLHGKTNSEIAAICRDIAEERDHYKRELGMLVDATTLTRLAIRWYLTPKECALVAILYERKGACAGRELLLAAMYGGAYDTPEIKIIDVFLCKARKKMGAELFKTHWGVGYSLTPAGVAAVTEAVTVAQC
jgi:DNA-binding response OmpR family regulator